MRAVVTGGAGFIGSHLVDALIDDGADVLVVDDLSRGLLANLEPALDRGARLAKLDVRDGFAVDEAFRSFRPELVFHLAAQIDVRTSMDEPARDAAVNVLGSVNVFSAAHAAGARRVVNTSTGGAIYGVAAVVPTSETVAADPVSAYGLSKLTAERYARWFRRTRGLDVVTLRYGNAYGPRQDPRCDAGVIAIFCDRVLTGRRPTIYGDGRQTRDYVFVGDIVSANLATARAAEPAHGEYNVGTGTEVTVLELVGAVAAAAGVDPVDFEPDFAPARPGELVRSCLDVTRARCDLGLPLSTPLPEGLARTLDWVRTGWSD
ncbi:MAG TPA: NAD-dependent epimerase/dehydratase family protein [Pseudonocardiaceae bacterium]|nr:NAD-dependent epimerase/dehydratase family protein [Pseudonocardiaceae bacterium]